MEILWIVLAPFLVAPFAPFLVKALPRAAGWLLAIVPAMLFVLLARHVPAISAGGRILESVPWVPGLDVSMAFDLDGFSLLFALLITGIGALVAVYAGSYLGGDRDLGRFYGFFLLFMGSMLGVVLADDVIALFVFWELTSLSSFFLIGYYHEDPVARRNALQALLVTAAGGLALLAGLLILSNATGTTRISEILSMGDQVRAHPHYIAILVLVLAGAFTKSAQFPFHFWLPNAMSGPTPVSAYLHSATMVKAGVYLLARFRPVLGGTEPWLLALVLFGGATMLLGAYLSFRHTDMKTILAYTTLSALGTLVFLLGLGSPGAAKAAILFLVAHALYKGALFLLAGIVDHETGTREITRLGALARSMPITTVAMVLAALSLAGVLPVFAFIAKEASIEAALHAEIVPLAVTAAIALTGVFFVAVAAKLAYRPFFGPAGDPPKSPHEAPLALLLGPVVLAVTGLVFGLLPRFAPQKLFAQAASAVHAADVPVKLALWHGINPALLVSLSVVILGILLYAFRDRAERLFAPLDPLAHYAPEANYHRTLAAALRYANWQTRSIQTTHLRHYFIVILLTATIGAGGTVLLRHGIPVIPHFEAVPLHELVVALMIVVGAIFTTVARSAIAAIISLGLVGYGIALLFVIFGAPDLAATQFLFETLIVLLLTFVVIRMPAFVSRSSTAVRLRDAALGTVVGLLATMLAVIAIGTTFYEPISGYFAENSYLLAHGRNVVNVILVDFRGLDTLGETVVIAVAAVGSFALLSMRHRTKTKKEGETPPPEEANA